MIALKSVLILLVLIKSTLQTDGYCEKDTENCNNVSSNNKKRYLFYDVNPPEGFNLRRDVYMRYATWAHKLNKSSVQSLNNFQLVLPPWSHLYHWKYSDEPEFVPWSYYFDLESLQKFAPVIEMHQFFAVQLYFVEIGVKYSKINIDEVYVLQHYDEMFKSGKFVEKMSVEKCKETFSPNYFYYSNITSKNVRCLSFHGFTNQLTSVLDNSPAKTFLFLHGEIALHDNFGDKLYWQCRRSMKFNKDLIKIANDFRRNYLESTDSVDNTELPEDWRKEKPKRNAKGGPYLSVHLRRGDFVRSRPKETPSIGNAVKQIKTKLTELGLQTVFVATDAKNDEINQLKSMLDTEDFKTALYVPTKSVRRKYGDGGIAIIEQIICSYARYFIGTHESTFSFRIQEEREIIGFPVDATFNRFCGDKDLKCEPPSKWKIVY